MAQRSAPGAAELAHEAATALRDRTGGVRHVAAIVLGSGWAAAADAVGETTHEIPVSELPGFAVPTAEGHGPTVRSVVSDGRHVLIFLGRTHLYEGRGVDAVVHPVRTAAAAGVKTLILTNGSGGINRAYQPGWPVLIADQINLTATSPLVGPDFVDLTDLYTRRLRDLARAIDPALDEGVYVQVPGPQYETRAEIRHLRAIGGDLVGMSTALEAIAARAAGLDLLGISLVTNAAAGVTEARLDHADVLATGEAAADRIGRLLAEVVRHL